MPTTEQGLGRTFIITGHRKTEPGVQTKLAVSRPGDACEEEADRIAEQVGGASPTDLPPISRDGSAVHRQCAGCEGGAPCPECEGENTQVQRKIGAKPDSGDSPLAGDLAGNLGPGFPLDSATRNFMEPRLGYDFGGVRLHDGSTAAQSADAVSARAFTLGRDVVFGAGQFAPQSDAGRQLLAHELVHVVQQQGLAEAEYETGPIMRAPKDRDYNAPPPPSPGPSKTATQATCGPDVTAEIAAAITKTRSTFGGWSNPDKKSACDALDSLSTGAVAWDIVELHNNAWILGYRPACATQGATPPCGSTVQVGKDCYYAGSPNYVIFGVMCKLCNSHFTSVGDAKAADRFTESRMTYWVNFYKGTGPLGVSTPSGNFGPSRDWAIAGYRGWPGATAPAGDRNSCTPACPTAYSGGAFSVNWVPKGVF